MSLDTKPTTPKDTEIDPKAYSLWEPLADTLKHVEPETIAVKAAADDLIDEIKKDTFKLDTDDKNCAAFFAQGNQLLAVTIDRIENAQADSQRMANYYGGRQIFRVLMAGFEYYPALIPQTQNLIPKSLITRLPCRRDWYIGSEQTALSLAPQDSHVAEKLPAVYYDPMYYALQAKNKTIAEYLLQRKPQKGETTSWVLPAKDDDYPYLNGEIWKFYEEERRTLAWRQASQAVIAVTLAGKNIEKFTLPAVLIALIQEYDHDLDQPAPEEYQFDPKHLEIDISPEELIGTQTSCRIL